MKYLTLMIVPYPGADVRSYRIQHRTLKMIAAVAALLLVASVSALIYLRPVFNKAKEYDRLKAENQLLSLEKQKIRDLSRKIKSIDELVEKIQLAQGVKEFRQLNNSQENEQQESALQPERHLLKNSSSAGIGSARRDEEVDSKMPYGIPIDEKSYISRFFNPEIYHFGIDIALKQGTPVKATGDGVVTIADQNEELGYYIMIKHASGYSTLYAHNIRLTVESGDRVKKGTLIAYSGNLGQSSGPHLHYAIFDQNGNPVDPLPFLER